MQSDSKNNNKQSTLLYVDDDPANLKLVKTILKLHTDILFLSAETGEEGLELAQSQSPDIILLDINIPDIDGFQLLARLKTLPQIQNTPVLALSGDNRRSDVDKGMASGFKHYLSKPFEIDEFLAIVKSELE